MKIEIGSGVMTRNSKSTCIIFGNNVLQKSEVGIQRKMMVETLVVHYSIAIPILRCKLYSAQAQV
jgi:hypothetical protein